MFRTFFVALLVLSAGCAYYNTFYNARASYNEALEYAREHPDEPAAQEKQLLDRAIIGASKVLARYPDSRWIDDAQLLLGDALLLRGKRSLVGSGTSDFTEAMQAYSSVLLLSDNTAILDRARLGEALAAMELGRYNDAASILRDVSAENTERHAQSRLLLCRAYLNLGYPEQAEAVFDTLQPSGGDSLEAEYYITGGEILTAMGMPDSGAVFCLRATEVTDRGTVFYRALVKSAEMYIQAGLPEKASEELDILLQGYRSNREMADIFLLKGMADELAGNTDAALASYLDASELDTYSETGAEALYRRALLLEKEERYDDAVLALNKCASRPGDYMWLRLAADRERDLNRYLVFSDSIGSADHDKKVRYTLLAAETRLDLFGMDEKTREMLHFVANSDVPLFSSMATVYLAENGEVPEDSVEAVLVSVLNRVPESDLAGSIEQYLGLPPGTHASRRPSALLEKAWELLEQRNWQEAWVTVDGLLKSPYSYEVRAEALWVAYLAAEGARMEGSVVNSYLRELVEDYPETPQGEEAALRLAVGIGGEEDPGDDDE